MFGKKRADLLIELGSEELPPRALGDLSDALLTGICQGLSRAGIGYENPRPYATPRRLAVLISKVDLRQPDRKEERLGPPLTQCFDDDGNPTPALAGFARSCGVEADQLSKVSTDKGERIAWRSKVPGQSTTELLPDILKQAVAELPVPRRMRWGAGEAEFVRPLHWLIVLLGDSIVPMSLLGLDADRITHGHRFHAPDPIELESPDEYESALAEAHVLVDFEERRTRIQAQVQQAAVEAGGQALLDEALLDEVTALVEWPVAVLGSFDESFLELPREVLVAVMQGHQRYFAVEDANSNSEDRLLPTFVTISNIESSRPESVRRGNERVIRPRFNDALFFWEQDRRHSMEEWVEGLANVTHQQDLGSIADRSKRIEAISRLFAQEAGFDPQPASRAARLAKADLQSQMVYEFPELQGIMGRYYASEAGEPELVAQAIEDQYLPRHAGDRLPESDAGTALAVADKLDLIAGIVAIGQRPTGNRDPYGLRRAAIGVLRILLEKQIDIDLQGLAAEADRLQPVAHLHDNSEGCWEFLLDRLRGILALDHERNTIDAVIAVGAARPLELQRRVRALEAFLESEDAPALCAAHKRATNILRSSEVPAAPVDESLLQSPAEKVLSALLESVSGKVDEALRVGDFQAALQAMARLREPVDEFFDDVMVMAEDEDLRRNRLAILHGLDRLFGRVADLGRVSAG